jgi:hypothetical protein
MFQLLKGQFHEIFASSFFHESSSPKPLKITLGAFRIFLTNSQRYSQVKVNHREMGYSGAWGKLSHEKNQIQKSRGTVPVRALMY